MTLNKGRRGAALVKLWQSFVAGYDRVIDGAAFLAGIILLYVMLQITLGVVLRYAYDYTFRWQMEFVEFMLVVVCFLAISWVLKMEGHVSVSVMVDKFKPRVRDALHGVLSILMAIMCFVCTYYAVEVTVIHLHSKLYVPLVLNLPVWVYVLFIAIGMPLLAVQCVRRAIKNLRAWRVSPEASGTQRQKES